MPVMDGLECAARIRTMPGFRELPILAMTANAMAGDRDRSLAAGMNDHVTKPIEPDELFDALHRWLPERGRATPAADRTADGRRRRSRRWHGGERRRLAARDSGSGCGGRPAAAPRQSNRVRRAAPPLRLEPGRRGNRHSHGVVRRPRGRRRAMRAHAQGRGRKHWGAGVATRGGRAGGGTAPRRSTRRLWRRCWIEPRTSWSVCLRPSPAHSRQKQLSRDRWPRSIGRRSTTPSSGSIGCSRRTRSRRSMSSSRRSHCSLPPTASGRGKLADC